MNQYFVGKQQQQQKTEATAMKKEKQQQNIQIPKKVTEKRINEEK